MNPRLARRLLIAAIIVLTGLLVFLGVVFMRLQVQKPAEASSGSTDIAWVRSMYGSGPGEAEMLSAPSSVAIGPNGEVYVTDPTRSRVLVFAADGTFQRTVASAAPGYLRSEFIRPEAVDVDPETGDLYIADSWARKVIVYDARGEYVTEWPVDVQARGVAVAGDRVYVLDAGKVIGFDKNGDRVVEFGRRGSEPGQIDAYLGIVSDGENVYIADSYNRRIQAFARDGRLLWVAPSSATTVSPTVESTETIESSNTSATGDTTSSAALGSAKGSFDGWQLPQDLTIDGAGRLVVIDAFRFEMVVVDPTDGTIIASYGSSGSADGRFYFPTSIAYDAAHDWFAIADTQNDRVQLVRIPGSSGSAWSGVRRVADSPWRHMLLPAALFVAAVITAAWAWVRLRQRTRGNGGPEQGFGAP